MPVQLAPFAGLNTVKSSSGVLQSRDACLGGHCHDRHTWAAVATSANGPRSTAVLWRCRQAAAGLRLAVSGSAALPLRLFDGWQELAGELPVGLSKCWTLGFGSR